MGRKKNNSWKRRKRRTVGLNWYRESALRAELRKITPSEPWVDEQIVTVSDKDENGTTIYYVFHNKKVFPPGGADTLMKRCPKCGVFTPPNAMEHGNCLDHARHKGWGPSPSAESIQRMVLYHEVTEPNVALEPEDEESLKREIEAWLLEHPEYGKSGTKM